GHVVADEHVVVDANAGADERVALDPDAAADGDVALNLDERADTALVADLAAVEIDELEDCHAATELHVVGDVDEASLGNLAHASLVFRAGRRQPCRLVVRVARALYSNTPRARVCAIALADVNGTARVALLYIALTVVLAYPLTRHPATSVLPMASDTDFFLWLLQWDVHALVHRPLSIFDPHIFFPPRH